MINPNRCVNSSTPNNSFHQPRPGFDLPLNKLYITSCLYSSQKKVYVC